MKNQANRPKMNFRERMMRFMYGRNGADHLGNTVLVLSFVLAIGNLFLQSVIVSLLVYACVIYSLFRMMSRNVSKRRAENARWCRFWKRIKGFFVLTKNKWRDRKTHVYYKCPQCKNVLRLPKVKGAHSVNCPCCHTRFEMEI